MKSNKLSIVAPCFNEESCIDIFYTNIINVLNKVNMDYEIIFINDGSTDKTFDKLIKLKTKNENIKIINLSRNFGKESALTAGLETSIGDIVISIDTDMQHPPKLIMSFINKWKEGYDVVVGETINRTNDSFLQKTSAGLFYKLYNKISDVSMPKNVGDYRLMTRRVAEQLSNLPENQRFMKGLFAWVGYKTAIVKYKREARIAGKSSFSGWRLWNFALNGITSFSTVPLKIWLYLGFIISFISFIYGSFIIIKTLIFGVDIPGYASMIAISLFLGGIQLMGIGILGEYIGRIYFEAKRRPPYIIEHIY